VVGRSGPKVPEESVAERLAARERVILDREVELYRLRRLAFPHGGHRRRRRPTGGSAGDVPAAPG
jgi:hypothetical protein